MEVLAKVKGKPQKHLSPRVRLYYIRSLHTESRDIFLAFCSGNVLSSYDIISNLILVAEVDEEI